MTVIGTNTASLRAGNASNSANMQLSSAMERLSTGKRINSAKDDAAGLATPAFHGADGLHQAVGNAGRAFRRRDGRTALGEGRRGQVGGPGEKRHGKQDGQEQHTHGQKDAAFR